MIETPSISIWRKKAEFGLALSSPHDPVLHTPLTNLSPILHKRGRAIINNRIFFARYDKQGSIDPINIEMKK
jgi:hypothetical protein